MSYNHKIQTLREWRAAQEVEVKGNKFPWSFVLVVVICAALVTVAVVLCIVL